MFPLPIRSRSVAAVFAALLLFTAACGGSDGDESGDQAIATLTEDTADDTGDADTSGGTDEAAPDGDDDVEAPEDPEDAFALFDECMAEAGIEVETVGAVGDGRVEVDSGSPGEPPGEVDPQAGGGSFEDFGLEEFEAANEACEGHLANIDGGFDLSPEQEAAMEDAQLEWTKCMSDQGVEVPELDDAGSGSIVVEGAVEVDPQTGEPSFEDSDFDFEGFEEAAQSCQSVYERYEELDGLFDGEGSLG